MRCTEIGKALDVGVDPAAADAVSSRLGKPGLPESCQNRSCQHYRTPQRSAFADKFIALDIGCVDVVGPEAEIPPGMPCHRDSHPLEQADEVHYVQDFGYVGDSHLILGEKSRTNDLECLILGTLRRDFSAEPMSSLDYESVVHEMLY